jgi:GT2 family glycosyltransferase
MTLSPDSFCARVAAVVVNWNGKDYTLECLQSLQKQQEVKIQAIVVDNDSTDGSVISVREQFPDTVIIESGDNLGYAGGNNLGLTYALDQRFEYVFVLNNDTVLAADCAYELVSDLEAHPDAAAAAPKSYYLELPDTIYFAGGKVSRDGQVFHIGEGSCDGPQYSSAGEAAWLNGCAILFRNSALREIGLFEPEFFLMFEDADWSLRARRAGYRLRFVPGARLWHKASPSFGTPQSPLALYYFTRNQFLWIERNCALPKKLAFYCFALARVCVNGIFKAGKLSTEIGRRRRSAICRGIGDYVFRRFGQKADS